MARLIGTDTGANKSKAAVGARFRILNAEPLGYSQEARAILDGIGRVDDGPLTRTDLLAAIPSYDVLIVRLGQEVDRRVIDAGARLKAIVSPTTGLDHIDVDYASSKGIKVLSLRDEHALLRNIPATAEHTWALLLALVRRIPWAFRSVESGAWDRDAFRGAELMGKRLGIVGLGRIGEMVSRYGLAFGMRVAAVDRSWNRSVPGVERVPGLGDLLQRSDVVSLHVPGDPDTDELVGATELDAMPRGSVLVNTSRGRVVQKQALVRSLEKGHLAGAALDVIDDEQNPDRRDSSSLLAYARTHSNLLITPHIGGATHESMEKTEVFMARTLAAFLRGLEGG